MESKEEEIGVIEAVKEEEQSGNESNNNFEEERYAKGNGVRKKDETATDKEERRRKYFQQYIYQQNYQEALRSLLWEPYECRNSADSWYCEGLEEEAVSKVPKRKLVSSSESSASSSSSCCSLDDMITVEMNSVNVERCEPNGKRTSLTVDKERRRGIRSVQGEDERTLAAESGRGREEAGSDNGFFESECATDPVQKLMNIEIMVSDLHTRNGSDCSSRGERVEALASDGSVILASASQCKLGSRGGDTCRCSGGENALSTVGRMLVTVEGTLEPRDSSEVTQLVSPDASLDVADGPANVVARSGEESDPSGSSVSVVNCYRAVPVAVVSTVPMIKCLNAQENVSNVSIIQTGSAGKYPRQSHPKRSPPRASTAPAPSTSKARPKVSKPETRRCSTLEQKSAIRDAAKSGSLGQGGSALTNHNRSVSNPVLGNETASPNRFGSQQNIPIRPETHFGSTDGPERPQTLGTSPESLPVGFEQVNATVAESPKPRTFISTEAQTDDVPLGISLRSNREQRRRERRERRHQRRLHQSVLSSGSVWQTNVDNVARDARGLPDILNSHMPPPYSAVTVSPPPLQQPIHISPHGMPVPQGPQPVPPHLMESPPGSPPSHQGGVRFPFPFPGSGRR